MRRQIAAALLLLAGLALFLSLGVWQLQRLHWKEALLAELSAQIEAEPGPLPAAPDPTADRFRPVAVTGEMGAEQLDVLVSSKDYGPGFRIVSSFVTTEGRRILIDRGFVPTEGKDAPRATGEMEVVGNLHWPDERDRFTPADDPAGNWWYARDVAKMAATLGTEPVLLVARSQTDPTILPMPVSTESIRNKHLEYAWTWFLLAATWVVMTGYALWRIRRRNRTAQA